MFTKQVLPNGLTVVVEEIPYVRSVSVGVWVAAGSRYESDENAGTGRPASRTNETA